MRSESRTSFAGRLRGTARALLAFVAVLPFLPAVLDGVGPLSVLARVLDSWFAYQCERDPSRMLAVESVCARCLGIYLGFGLGALLARPRASERALRVAIALGLTLLLLDVFSEGAGLRGALAPSRVVSGLVLAYPVGVMATRALHRGGNASLGPGLPKRHRSA